MNDSVVQTVNPLLKRRIMAAAGVNSWPAVVSQMNAVAGAGTGLTETAPGAVRYNSAGGWWSIGPYRLKKDNGKYFVLSGATWLNLTGGRRRTRKGPRSHHRTQKHTRR
jgi:hypothetical protein